MSEAVESNAGSLANLATIGSTDPSSQLGAVFGVLRGLEPRPSDFYSIRKVILIGVFIEAVQPLGFILSPHIAWSQEWVGKVAYFFQLGSLWDPEMNGIGRYAAVALFWIAVAFLVTVWSLLFYMFKSKTDKQTVLSVARGLTHALTVPLLLPVIQILLAQMVCSGEALWLFPDAQCWDGLHFLTFLCGLLGLLGTAFTALAVLTSVFDNDSISHHPVARAHTQLDRWYLVFRVAAAVAYHCLLARSMQQSYCWLMFVSSAAMAVAFALVMPYYKLGMLRARVLSLVTLSWASLVAFLLHKDEGGNNVASDDTAVIVLLAPLPIVWAAGWFLASVRVSRRCVNDFKAVLTGAASSATAAWLPRHLPESCFYPSALQGVETRFLEFDKYITDESTTSAAAATEPLRPSVFSPFVESVYWPSDVELATRTLLEWYRHFLTHPTGAMLGMTARIYGKGVCKFPDSPIVRIHCSMFLIRYLEGSSVAVSWLSSLEHLDCLKGDMASRYVVFRLSMQLKAELGIRDRSHLQALATARRFHRDALDEMLQFWSALCDKDNLNLMSLAVLANNITNNREKALASFCSVLSQHASDTQILGAFSTFLLQVMLDEESHDRCREELDNLQEMRRSRRANRAVSGAGGEVSIMQTTTIATSTRAGGGVSKAVQGILVQIAAKSATANASRTVQIVKATIFIVFAPLVLLLIAFLLLAFFFSKSHERLLEQTQSAGQVRYLAQYACMVLQQLRAEALVQGNTGSSMTGAGGVDTVELQKDKLRAIAESFGAHHNRLTFGALQAAQPAVQDYFKKPSLPYTVHASEGAAETRIVGLWSLGNALYTAMLVLCELPSGSIAGSPYTRSLLGSTRGPVANAFNHTADFLAEDADSEQRLVATLAIALFVAAILMIYVVDLAFVWNFNKIAASKVTTLELFTLIPESTLRQTQEAAKDKVTQFDKSDAESKGQFSSAIQNDDDDAASEESEDRPPDVQVVPPHEDSPDAEGRRMSESTQQAKWSREEALKSLEDRRYSIIANVLARGQEESKLQEEELGRSQRIERTGSLHTSKKGGSTPVTEKNTLLSDSGEGGHPVEQVVELGKGGQQRETVLPPERSSETAAGEMAILANAAAAEEEEEEEQSHHDDSREVPTAAVVLVMVVVLGLQIAASSMAFRVYSSGVDEKYDTARDATRHTLELGRLTERQIDLARDFSQFADLRYYALYWLSESRAERRAVLEALWRIGLVHEEVEVAIEITESWARLHHYHQISMKLMGDFQGIPRESMPEVRGVSQYSWEALHLEEPRQIRRSEGRRIRPAPPYARTGQESVQSAYMFSHCCQSTGDMAADNDLPDQETSITHDALGHQRVRVHDLYKYTMRMLGYHALGDTATEAVKREKLHKSVAEFHQWHSRLKPTFTTAVSDKIRAPYEAIRQDSEILLQADSAAILLLFEGQQALASADAYDDALGESMSAISLDRRKGMARLFANSPDREVHQARSRLEGEAYDKVLAHSSAGERVLRDVARIFMVAATGQSGLAQLRATEELRESYRLWPRLALSVGDWSYQAGTEEQLIRSSVELIISANVTTEISSTVQDVIHQSEDKFHEQLVLKLKQVPGEQTRLSLGEMKAQVARGVLFNDVYRAEAETLRAALRELREMLTERTAAAAEDAASTEKSLVITCIALFAAAAAVAVCMLSAFRVWLLVLLVFTAVAAVGVTSQISPAVDDLQVAYARLHRLQLLRNSTSAEVDARSESAQEFAQYADGLAFESYVARSKSSEAAVLRGLAHPSTFTEDALEAVHDHPDTGHDQLQDPRHTIADADALLEAAAWQSENLRSMERTAVALSATAAGLIQGGYLKLPVGMQRHTWNFSAEHSYQEDALRFTGPLDSPLKYSTPAGDIACGVDCDENTIQDKARAVLTSSKYKSTRQDQRLPVVRILGATTSTWEQAADDARSSMQTFAVVAIVLGLAGVAEAVGIMLATVAMSLRQRATRQQRKGNTGTHMQDQMNTSLFTNMTRRIRVALFVVVALVTVLFAVLYTGQQATDGAVRTLNFASMRQWLVARANVAVQSIEQGSNSVQEHQWELRRLAKEMQRVNDKVYFGDDSGKYGMVASDSTLDELLFGSAANVSLAGIHKRYRSCSVATTTGTAVNPAEEPVNIRYLSHLSKLNAIAFHPDRTSQDRALLLGLAGEATLEADEVIEGLERSSTRYKDTAVTRSAASIFYCSVIVAITIIVIAAEYRFVFLPMMSQLATEEDGTKLMLSMIPADVRESVPEIAEFFSTGRISEEEKIKKQLQQSEKLLQNILPPAIARRLKAGESPIADDHTAITVAFCACVGFDEISRGMSANAVVNFLNDLFTRFDEITDRLDLEKIKTIGDIYFMCGGLTEKTSSDHALRVMDAVLCFFEALEDHKQRYEAAALTMKAGVNTGPAVAGVIGSKKVAYDLWGDAVNVSSRLCGTGLDGKVSVNPSTYELVDSHFAFKVRWVEAKGKGRLQTYVLESRTQPSPFAQLASAY
eukprot:TRINITY_DN850_c0_g2_i2.p1 TRINITY_DN850_c0_g2~~TRINITY_DN850_c0_g2_i2.p1  ORF type:complete len:2536 (+),score=828.09 TRINITY_DN850_c0_g2_i2:91-7608(+)